MKPTMRSSPSEGERVTVVATLAISRVLSIREERSMADETYVYVGAEAHGLYRKQASDTHWEQLTNGMPPMPQVRPIVIHPQHPEIMFLGTEGSEVYTSNDAGETWHYMSTIVNPDAVQMAFATRILGLAIEPPNPNRMYAALEVGGAARSADGGKSWELVNRYFNGNVDLMDLHGVALRSPQADVVCIANRVGV